MTRKERILTKARNPKIDHSKCAKDHIEIKATPAGEKALIALGFSIEYRRKYIDYNVWHIPDGMSLEQAVETIADIAGVEDVAYDYAAEPCSLPFALDSNGLPNDSLISQQMATLNQMGITGTPSMWNLFEKYPFELATPIIGIYERTLDITHEDFQGQYLLPPVGGTLQDPFTGDGRHFVSVSGIMAAKAGNALGIAGLAFNSKIHMGAGYNLSYAFSYVDYCIQNGIKIVNISYGMPEEVWDLDLPIWLPLAKAAKDNNVVICAAAGNFDRNHPTRKINGFSLGEGVFTVAGLQQSGVSIHQDSFYNEYVTFCAPFSVFTLDKPNSGTAQAFDSYAIKSGTSFATPVIVSLVALLRTINPNFTYSEIEQIIAMSCKPFVPPAGKPVYGYGIPHFRTAITIAMNNAVGLYYGDMPIRQMAYGNMQIASLTAWDGEKWVESWRPTAKLF